MNDLEYRDLQERSALIEELSKHPGWTMLVDRAHATLAARQQRLIGGRIKDYEEYRAECGFIDGAFFVLHLPNTVNQELVDETAYREERKAAEEEEAA
jgi:hypothetical protein